MPDLETQIRSRDEKSKEVVVYQTINFSHRGSAAVDFVKVMLTSPSVPDGFTPSGDLSFRPRTPREIVDISLQLTELLFADMLERGWVVSAPPLSALKEDSGAVQGFTRD